MVVLFFCGCGISSNFSVLSDDGILTKNSMPSAGMAKVYISSISNATDNNFIEFSGLNKLYLIDDVGVSFLHILKQQLQSSDIIVANSIKSPYTLKLDIIITDFQSTYDRHLGVISSSIDCIVKIKNINYDKTISLSAKYKAENLFNKNHLYVYTDKLLQKLADQVAQIVNKI